MLYLSLGLIATSLALIAVLLPRESPPPVRLPDVSSLRVSKATGTDATATDRTGTEQPSREPVTATQSPGASAPKHDIETGPTPSVPPAGSETSTAPASYGAAPFRGKLIFVIDDVGYNLDELRPFLSFPGPLTLSVMPQRPYTVAAYHLILQAGKFPILHQPMEADGNVNPGPGAIYTSMSAEQIDSVLTENLQGMGAITWVNNHEGSKATSDPETMLAVLSYLKERNMHFLDSRTTAATVVPEVDRKLGLPYYERNSIFLDDVVGKPQIEQAISYGLRVAQRVGYAVMIGHVWDKDLARILIDSYPRLASEGFAFDDVRALEKESLSNAGPGN